MARSRSIVENIAAARLVYLGSIGNEEAGLSVGATFELAEGRAISIGRARPTDVLLAAPGVARLHAVIAVVSGLRPAAVCDLSSTNGTTVRGERIQGAMLCPGDELVCAGTFRFRFDRDEA